MPYEAGRVAIGNLIPGGTAGSVLFVGAAGELAQDNANFSWDDTNNKLLLASGSVAHPPYTFAADPDTGPYLIGAGILGFSTNGANTFSMRNSASAGFQLANGVPISWAATPSGGAGNLLLVRDADNILAQRNGTNAQEFRVYNTFTSAANNEYGGLLWSSNVFFVGATETGATARDVKLFSRSANGLYLRTNATDRWQVGGGSGNLLAVADNSYDIGATGATRPRSIYVGTSVQIEANNGLKFTNAVDGAAAGAGTLANAPAAGNPTFWLPVTVNGANKHIPCW